MGKAKRRSTKLIQQVEKKGTPFLETGVAAHANSIHSGVKKVS